MYGVTKRKWLALEEKVKIVNESLKDPKPSQRQLAERFGVSKTQVLNILKDAENIEKVWRENGTNQKMKKKMKTGESGSLCLLDSVVYDWFCAARLKRIPISGPIIQEKAFETAKLLNVGDFKASNGWLDRFKTRHNISCKVIRGESADVPTANVEEWKTKLNQYCQGYAVRDIFNCDETGLFYRALPNRTLRDKNDKSHGGKTPKSRLTLLLCANMDGEFEDPLIIGNASRPRCFKNVKLEQLKMSWRANKNSWMTREIMSEWLEKFNKKMKRQKRSVLLFMDNATCHPNLQLSNVKIVFFPPNTTSVCQPLDFGIIKCFKSHYRKLILRRVISNIDSGAAKASELEKKVSVLDAIMWTIAALKCISASAVQKCFKKAGFTDDTQLAPESSMQDNSQLPTDDELSEEIEGLVRDVSDDVTAEQFITFDDDLPTCSLETDIQAIVDGLQTGEEDTEDQDEEETGHPIEDENCPRNYATALDLVKQLHRFSLKENNTRLLEMLSDVQREVEHQVIAKRKQSVQKQLTD